MGTVLGYGALIGMGEDKYEDRACVVCPLSKGPCIFIFRYWYITHLCPPICFAAYNWVAGQLLTTHNFVQTYLIKNMVYLAFTYGQD